MVKNEKIDKISLDGGSPCFHFINTVHNWVDATVPDYLLSPIDIVAWAKKAEVLGAEQARLLEQWTLSNPGRAKQGLMRAKELRKILHNIFHAISEQKKVNSIELQKFNSFLADFLPKMRLKNSRGKYVQYWDFPNQNVDVILAPLAKDAYDLLLSEKLDRIKNCPSCGWIFLDTSRNGSRRWCSMKSCGSNVKALQWYYRQKESRKQD